MHAQLAQQPPPGARGDADGQERRRSEQRAFGDGGPVPGQPGAGFDGLDEPEGTGRQRCEHPAEEPEHAAGDGDGERGRHGCVGAQDRVGVQGSEPDPRPDEHHDDRAHPFRHAAM